MKYKISKLMVPFYYVCNYSITNNTRGSWGKCQKKIVSVYLEK